MPRIIREKSKKMRKKCVFCQFTLVLICSTEVFSCARELGKAPYLELFCMHTKNNRGHVKQACSDYRHAVGHVYGDDWPNRAPLPQNPQRFERTKLSGLQQVASRSLRKMNTCI